MKTLNTFVVVPAYTFFYWGFTLPQKEYLPFIKYFNLNEKSLSKKIVLIINNKKYIAKIRLARITTENFPNRKVVQIFYDTQYDTLKALRNLFIYSYAITIDKKKPLLKEIVEIEHIHTNTFKLNPIVKQKTEFDDMFHFLENKNLFKYWKSSKKINKSENFFIDFSRKWISVEDLDKYRDRCNVIYCLYHSKKKQLYVGKANILGSRVKKNEGRIGLDKDWDKFTFFEIDPKYNNFIEQIEAFTIRSFASLLENDLGTDPLNDKNIRLVNKQLRKK